MYKIGDFSSIIGKSCSKTTIMEHDKNTRRKSCFKTLKN